MIVNFKSRPAIQMGLRDCKYKAKSWKLTKSLWFLKKEVSTSNLYDECERQQVQLNLFSNSKITSKEKISPTRIYFVDILIPSDVNLFIPSFLVTLKEKKETI